MDDQEFIIVFIWSFHVRFPSVLFHLFFQHFYHRYMFLLRLDSDNFPAFSVNTLFAVLLNSSWSFHTVVCSPTFFFPLFQSHLHMLSRNVFCIKRKRLFMVFPLNSSLIDPATFFFYSISNDFFLNLMWSTTICVPVTQLCIVFIF